jgi:hypothetical protein
MISFKEFAIHEGIFDWLKRKKPQTPAFHKDNAPEKETTSDQEKHELLKHFVNWTHDNNPQAFMNIRKAFSHPDQDGKFETDQIGEAMDHLGNAFSKYRDHYPNAWHHEEVMHVMKHVFKHKGMPPAFR